MSLAADLLEQASHLADRETARPKQASLRRAISAAYYALFHLLSSEAASIAAPASPINLRAQVQRALIHEEMKNACAGIRSGNPNLIFLQLAGRPSENLTRVATAFVELQDARYEADYNVIASFTRIEVKLLLLQCQTAFTAWQVVRGTDEANVFLAALLSQKRWNR